MGDATGARSGGRRLALDPSRLDALREIDPGLAAEVAAVWLRTTPTLLERLAGAAASGDAVELTAAAHALRGSSANVGADALADACGELERADRERLPLSPAMTAVSVEYARAAAALAEVATTG